MKPPKAWLSDLSGCGTSHPADCCCDRCKHGNEVFLLESDIKAIQDEAFKAGMMHAAQLADSGYESAAGASQAIFAKANKLP